jgi:hypothetical protein
MVMVSCWVPDGPTPPGASWVGVNWTVKEYVPARVGVPVTAQSAFSARCRPGDREPWVIFIVKSSAENLSPTGEGCGIPSPNTGSTAPNGIPRFPGPTWQTLLLQAKTDVSMTGGR